MFIALTDMDDIEIYVAVDAIEHFSAVSELPDSRTSVWMKNDDMHHEVRETPLQIIALITKNRLSAAAGNHRDVDLFTGSKALLAREAAARQALMKEPI